MRCYACFGLVVRSTIELPELESAPTDAPIDVVVRTGPLTGPPAGAVALPHGLWSTADRCGVHIDGVAGFEAREGREIVVDPATGADPRAVRLYLLGTLMGAVLTQRGHLVLHGCAFGLGRTCAVVVGHAGAGKSTLAAEMQRRGLEVLSDDIVPVDAAGRALPSYPRMKLWADALARLGVGTNGLPRLHADHAKFQVPLTRHAREPLPVRSVYALEGPGAKGSGAEWPGAEGSDAQRPGTAVTITPVTGMATFDLLAEHTYRRELLHDRAAAAAHLRRCAALASGAGFARVRRPPGVRVEDTADAILAEVGVRRAVVTA